MNTRTQNIPIVGTVLGLMVCVSLAEHFIAKHGWPGFVDDAVVILCVLMLSIPWVTLAAEDRPIPDGAPLRRTRTLLEILRWAAFGFVSPLLTLVGIAGMVIAFFAALRG
ncbi:MAG: hypothetical protein ACP5VE_12895 [Chthonomonadales bacterium]